jgi:AraC family transcriptional regulator
MSFSPISHGHQLRYIRTPGFAVTEASYPGGLTIPRHDHEAPSLTFVLNGGLDEVVQGRSEVLGPRELLLKPGATSHSNQFGPSGARLLLVEVFQSSECAEPAVARAFRRASRVAAGRVVAPLHHVSRELDRPDQYSAIAVEGLLLELVADLARLRVPREAVPEATFLRRTRERLHAEYKRPLRVRELAELEGVHPVRLARGFRARYGCGIAEYLRRVRLQEAMNALASTDDAIATISLRTGFSDQSHLTRELKRATGMTPAAYRQQLRR